MIALLIAAAATFAPNNLPVQPDSVCKNQMGLQTSAADPALLLRPQDRAAGKFSRLGDLPKANKEFALMRSVAGCNVPVGISYGVEGDGRFANADRAK